MLTTPMAGQLLVAVGLALVVMLVVLAVRLVGERRLRQRAEAQSRAALHELAHMNMRAGIGEVMSAVTHELAQSLTASLSHAQELKRQLTSHRITAGELPVIVDDIRDANRQASEIIGRIRSLMRKEPFDLQPLDVNVVVKDVVQVLYSTAANDGVLLVADLNPGLPSVNGDRVQLRQVVMNLVLNAIQATRATPQANPVVRVSTNKRPDSIVIVVDDSGPGVPDHALPRLFEPYYTTKEDGLGLGLSISRSIVQSHGGSIAVSNRAPGGARFEVALPFD